MTDKRFKKMCEDSDKMFDVSHITGCGLLNARTALDMNNYNTEYSIKYLVKHSRLFMYILSKYFVYTDKIFIYFKMKRFMRL